MGLLDSAKEAVGLGGGSDNADDIAESFAEEIESEVTESEGELGDDIVEDVEEEEEEWDSAYKFAEEFLEVRGFASMMDFTNKCMAYKVNQSPIYRDRISNGVETMDRITHMRDQMKEISGEKSEGTSYEEKAKKLKGANDVIDQAQKLSGQEDAMVNEIIGLGHQFADAIANNPNVGAGGANVNSNVESRENEEL